VKRLRVARGLSPSPRNLQDGLDFRFDRTQLMLFEPPSQVTIDILSNEYGKEYGDPTSRLNRRIVIYDFMTPETDTSCHYFWAIARDYSVDDPKVSEIGRRATSTAFHEDKRMLEAEQRIIDLDPSAPQIDIVGDTGGLQARRIVERLLADERVTTAAAQ